MVGGLPVSPRPGHARTSGPHFFAAVDGDRAVLREDDVRHLTTVLRARPGELVSVSDGRGSIWQGRLAGGDPGVVELQQRWDVPRARPAITVIHALPKARKLDDVVQRLTEIGVERIVPVHSERSMVRLDPAKAPKAWARWQAVAYAAAKQSRRAWLPVVAPVATWAEAFPQEAVGVVLWEESETPLRDVVAALPDADEILLAIGPEGGLTEAEVAATGLPHASLGATVLRTETAALVAVAAVGFALDRLG